MYVNVLIWLLILVQDFFSSSEIFDGIPSGIKLSDENWTGVSICFLEDLILLIFSSAKFICVFISPFDESVATNSIDIPDIEDALSFNVLLL